MKSKEELNYGNLFDINIKPNRVLKKLRKIFVPKSIRKRQDFENNLRLKGLVSDKWVQFIGEYFNGNFEKFELVPKKYLNNEKIIWQYWGQGIDNNLPEVVKICFASVDQYKGDYTVIRLDDNTIPKYLDLPSFVLDKRKNLEFKHAFFADLLRLALLSTYGGIWIDATVLLTSEINKTILDQDFFMFHRSELAQDKNTWVKFNSDYFGWDAKHKVNVLNSFIVSRKNNYVALVCLDIMLNYWKTQSHIPHYFFFQIMFNVLKSEYLNLNNFLIVDDTLPHLLQLKLNEKFDESDFKNILNLVNIHKMTYIDIQDSDTYYGFIKACFLGKEVAK